MPQDNLELIRRLYRRWGQGDFVTPEFFDLDVEMVRIGGDAAGTPGTWRGIEEMWRASVEWLQAWQDVALEAKRYVDLGDRVLVVSRHTGRGRRSGVELDQDNAQLFTLRDGKIIRWEMYLDVGDALRAAGLPD